MLPKIRTYTCILLFICSYSFGQIGEYNYKRELHNITGQWHKVVLPDDIYGKVSTNLTDLRIYGVTSKNDTLETPYILQLKKEKESSKEIVFKTINTSYNEEGYYFTFEISAENSINLINLNFNQKNFDWKLKLEGSQDQQKWYTVVENYRILSIKNKLTNYQFTKIEFPDSKYRYYRILIVTDKKPYLKSAKIFLNEVNNGIVRKYAIKKESKSVVKQTNQTEIFIDLEKPVPVSSVKIGVKDSFDYYRHATIKYLKDSVNTEQGWKYNYKTLTSGTLSSIENNELSFSNTTLKRLKVVINNHDNQPLTIDTLEVSGYVYELAVRFTESATYYLTYGNRKCGKPHYDINRFANKIPKRLTSLKLGAEQKIEKEEQLKGEPLFLNKIWLWGIMMTIIFSLGWFSVKIIRKE